jgi:hypothetical protein
MIARIAISASSTFKNKMEGLINPAGCMKLARALLLQEGSFKVLSGRARGRGEDMSNRNIGI